MVIYVYMYIHTNKNIYNTHVHTYIPKHSLLNRYNATCMYIPRVDNLSMEKQFACHSLDKATSPIPNFFICL